MNNINSETEGRATAAKPAKASEATETVRERKRSDLKKRLDQFAQEATNEEVWFLNDVLMTVGEQLQRESTGGGRYRVRIRLLDRAPWRLFPDR
jgi:hypothetical protein